MTTEDQQVRGASDGLVPRLAIIAWFASGASVGILVGHALSVGLSVNEFGALGNWVAGLGTLGALVLAYLVHRRDVKARDHDLRREEIKEYNQRKADEDRANAEAQAQSRHADLVSANLVVAGSSGRVGDDTRTLTHVKATVINRSSEPAADVVLRTRWRKIRPNWLEVSPRGRKDETIRLREATEIPLDKAEAREFIQENLELRFRMYDRLWSWTPEEGVRERTDDQKVAETGSSNA